MYNEFAKSEVMPTQSRCFDDVTNMETVQSSERAYLNVGAVNGDYTMEYRRNRNVPFNGHILIVIPTSLAVR